MLRRGVSGLLMLVCAAVPATAPAYSLLPLVTEQAETLPSGTAEAIIGVAYMDNENFPGFVPPGALASQTVIKVPQFGFRIGVGTWVEIEATYETIYLDERAANGQTNWQFGSGDMRIWTKVWLSREREYLPALGFHFGTKLPNANRNDRLGTDDTDFGADVVLSKDYGLFATHVNLGLMLLGNSGPTIGHSFSAGGQDDLLSYNVAVVSKPFGKPAPDASTVRLVGEITGLANSHRGENNDRSVLNVGLQLARGQTTLYAGVNTGLITQSQNIGASAGVIYRCDPWRWFDTETADSATDTAARN